MLSSSAACRIVSKSIKKFSAQQKRARPTALLSAPHTILASLSIHREHRTSLAGAMGENTCYAVARGRSTGLFYNWDECKAEVQGYKGSIFRGFATESEARAYLAQHGVSRGGHHAAAARQPPASYDQPPLVYHSAYQQLPTSATYQAPPRPSLKRSYASSSADYPNQPQQQQQQLYLPTTSAAAVPAADSISHATRTVRVQFDGASKRNPGPSAFGVVMYDDASGREVGRVKSYMGDRHTNNQAEYAGLIAGLQAALDAGYEGIEIQGDSTLVVNQVTGRWKVKNEGLAPYHRAATDLARRFKKFEARQVPRAENSVADALANEAVGEWRSGGGGERWTLERAVRESRSGVEEAKRQRQG